MTIKRILVGTDFSPDADGALAYALALAKALHASLHLLHVVENPLAAGLWSSDIYSAEIAGLQINLMRDAEEHLRRTIVTLDRSGVTLTTDVRTGRPAPGIVAFARTKETDLIVLGSHGRTGLSHLLMGSVAEQVVRTASCPVLVVRPVEHDTHREATTAQPVRATV